MPITCARKRRFTLTSMQTQNLMILKADISKTSTGRYLFLFIFICGNSKCTRIQKIKKFSGEVNWVPLALSTDALADICRWQLVPDEGLLFR